MKEKRTAEFEEFDKVMDGLLSVPYSELQKKLEDEKQAKQKKKRDALPEKSTKSITQPKSR
ncbi:MAG TPA: hypothetical protein VF543_17990 [Pyrinomonadaceae bacterium]|jgi:inner membrane protein involved in colicin E2 resistance